MKFTFGRLQYSSALVNYRLGFLTLFIFFITSYASAQDYTSFRREQKKALSFNQGFIDFQITGNNNGMLGFLATPSVINPYKTYGFKYYDYGIADSVTGESNKPAIVEGTVWVGAKIYLNDTIVTGVTAGYNNAIPSYVEWEFRGYTNEGDSVWRTSLLDQNKPNRRYFDDDGDGRIDEDELDGIDNDGDWLINRDDLNHNGKPDHGEPNVDEDYGAVSESDILVQYRDSIPGPRTSYHFPLGIKVVQKSYAWQTRVKGCIFPFEYYFINKGPYILDSVYAGFYFQALVSALIGVTERYSIVHLNDVQTVGYKAYRDISAPYVGVTMLGTKGLMGDIRFSVTNEIENGLEFGFPLSDQGKYRLMSSGVIAPDVTSDGTPP